MKRLKQLFVLLLTLWATIDAGVINAQVIQIDNSLLTNDNSYPGWDINNCNL
jgi:hypothetical protein